VLASCLPLKAGGKHKGFSKMFVAADVRPLMIPPLRPEVSPPGFVSFFAFRFPNFAFSFVSAFRFLFCAVHSQAVMANHNNLGASGGSVALPRRRSFFEKSA
jgi:hypothetical protein